MSKHLSLPLVTEAIILDALCYFDCYKSCRKTDESSLLFKLDLILSTVTNFADAFSEMFGEIFDNYCLEDLSEEEFINFVIPRGLILCQKKTYFNFVLTCSFMSEIVFHFISSFNCFHFAKLTLKCLLQIIKSKFEDLLGTESGWEGLLSFCEKTNYKVVNYNVKETASDNSLVSIKINKSDSLIEGCLIKQFKNFNIVGSEMNIIEDCSLQANYKGAFVNPDNLVDEKVKQNNIQNTNIIAFVDIPRELSNSSLLKETESTNITRCGKSNKIEFLYELLTDSSDHLNEVLSLIDSCDGDINPNISLIEYGDLCSDKQKISTMVAQKMCPSQHDISVCKCAGSKAIHSNEDKMVYEETGECFNSFMNTSDEDFSQCPSNSSECLSSTALDNECCACESNPLQYCELCKGKEDQYLKDWEKDFLERYPELQ